MPAVIEGDLTIHVVAAARKTFEAKDLVITKNARAIIAAKVVMNFIFEDDHIYSLVVVAAITVAITAY